MTKTINGLTVTTSAASGDLLPIWRAANNDTRKITKADFMGGVLTGSGTIATGGNTLTVAGTSTINGSVVGNMTGSGTVATGGFTLTVGAASVINGSFSGAVAGSLQGNMTGSGTIATGGFTGTLPATGTLALLGTAQTFSALNTFSAGISLGNETLSAYDEGTWTPALRFGGNAVGLTYASTPVGRYTRIGNRITASGSIQLSAVGSSTGAATIINLPTASSNVSLLYGGLIIWPQAMTFTGVVNGVIAPNSTTITLTVNNNGTLSDLTHAGFGATSFMAFTCVYQVG